MRERWLIDVYRVHLPDDALDDIAEATEDACNKDRDYYVQIQGESLKEITKSLMRYHEFEEMRKSNAKGDSQSPGEKL